MDHPSGIELKVLRIRSGVRQFQVAQRLGIPAPILSDLENGKRPITVERAKSISHAIADLAAQPAMKASDGRAA
jgi:transcriptional regulator with XRE-family HTH domain